jgi:hypothetical protein
MADVYHVGCVGLNCVLGRRKGEPELVLTVKLRGKRGTSEGRPEYYPMY